MVRCVALTTSNAERGKIREAIKASLRISTLSVVNSEQIGAGVTPTLGYLADLGDARHCSSACRSSCRFNPRPPLPEGDAIFHNTLKQRNKRPALREPPAKWRARILQEARTCREKHVRLEFAQAHNKEFRQDAQRCAGLVFQCCLGDWLPYDDDGEFRYQRKLRRPLG